MSLKGIIVISMFLLGIETIVAQEHNNFLVQKNGDTLFGEIQRVLGNKPYQVRFEGKVVKSSSVMGYSYKGQFYKSVPLSKKVVGEADTVFLLQIKKGQLSLYKGKYLWVGCGCGKGLDTRTVSVDYFIAAKGVAAVPIKSNSLGKVQNLPIIKEYYADLLPIKNLSKIKKKALLELIQAAN